MAWCERFQAIVFMIDDTYLKYFTAMEHIETRNASHRRICRLAAAITHETTDADWPPMSYV